VSPDPGWYNFTDEACRLPQPSTTYLPTASWWLMMIQTGRTSLKAVALTSTLIRRSRCSRSSPFPLVWDLDNDPRTASWCWRLLMQPLRRRAMPNGGKDDSTLGTEGTYPSQHKVEKSAGGIERTSTQHWAWVTLSQPHAGRGAVLPEHWDSARQNSFTKSSCIAYRMWTHAPVLKLFRLPGSFVALTSIFTRRRPCCRTNRSASSTLHFSSASSIDPRTLARCASRRVAAISALAAAHSASFSIASARAARATAVAAADAPSAAERDAACRQRRLQPRKMRTLSLSPNTRVIFTKRRTCKQVQ